MHSHIIGSPDGKKIAAAGRQTPAGIDAISAFPIAFPAQQRRGFERHQHRQREPGAIDRELIHRQRQYRQQRDEG